MYIIFQPSDTAIYTFWKFIHLQHSYMLCTFLYCCFLYLTSYSGRVFITDAALRRQASKLSMATPASPVSVEGCQQLLLSASLLPPLHDSIILFADSYLPPPEMQEFLHHLVSLSSVWLDAAFWKSTQGYLRYSSRQECYRQARTNEHSAGSKSLPF